MNFIVFKIGYLALFTYNIHDIPLLNIYNIITFQYTKPKVYNNIKLCIIVIRNNLFPIYF